ncbi:helix-turn-helix transcriptional regulator [Priestia megaterium]|nr:helix-turn-helix transcriptional regulator [Priestia megaterium]MBZ5482513.1 helix-turn-helix transcriptional regulator [Bacillus sp. T_4]MDN4865963.1 helix-turn-helix transcriptional regulator [Priestia megaterium]PET69594.1 transcriptional regulator [Priestia megaterium]PFI69621.1 transcriptional regulator [Priestia megaterium]PGK52792.1 transcriptional regulator [Priestia megaterium]
MELGEQLKSLREEKNMSREELAQRMNVSRQAIYKWETNKGYPDIENLIKLSDLYEITLDELIKNDRTFQDKISINRGKRIFEDRKAFIIGFTLFLLGISLSNIFTYAILLGIGGGILMGISPLVKVFK